MPNEIDLIKAILALTTRIAALEAQGLSPMDEPYLSLLIELGDHAKQIDQSFKTFEALTDTLQRLDGYCHFDASGCESHQEYRGLKDAVKTYLLIGEVPVVAPEPA